MQLRSHRVTLVRIVQLEMNHKGGGSSAGQASPSRNADSHCRCRKGLRGAIIVKVRARCDDPRRVEPDTVGGKLRLMLLSIKPNDSNHQHAACPA